MIEQTQKWNANFYDQRGSFVSNLAADLVDLLAPKPAERILDLGSGTGELAARIASAGALVTGVDFSEEMVRQACAKYPALRWLQQDGQQLQFTREFDAIFSNATLHWLLDAEAAARGIERALVPGGRLVAEFGGAGCVLSVRSAIADVLQAWGEDYGIWKRWYFPSIAEYSAVLERAGLSPRYMSLFDRPTLIEGEDGLFAWLKLFCEPLLQKLGSRAEYFAAEVAERTREQLFVNGNWVLDYVRIRLVAVKAPRFPTPRFG